MFYHQPTTADGRCYQISLTWLWSTRARVTDSDQTVQRGIGTSAVLTFGLRVSRPNHSATRSSSLLTRSLPALLFTPWGVLDKGDDGVCGKSLHTLYHVAKKIPQKYIPYCIKILSKVFIIHCFKRTLENILPHDIMSHNVLINCSTLPHNFIRKGRSVA